MGIEAYIAIGRDSYYQDLQSLLAGELEPSSDDADHKTKMLYKLRI